MRNKLTVIAVLVAVLPGSAMAAIGSSTSSSRSSSSTSSSSSRSSAPAAKPSQSKPSSTVKPKAVAPPKKAATPKVTTTKKATTSKTSSKVVLATRPPSIKGFGKKSNISRYYARDWARLRNLGGGFTSPYSSDYFGLWSSPFYYLWVLSLVDGDPETEAYPPEDEDGDDLSGALTSYLGTLPYFYELAEG